MDSLIRKKCKIFKFKLQNLNKDRFKCPICKYKGPFRDFSADTGYRKHAICPNCISLERHRLQYLVVQEIFKNKDMSKMDMIHFAPEQFFIKYFKKRFHNYKTADPYMPNVDLKVDLLNLPFEDSVYDVAYASHVLEHIFDDVQAIKEIKRILRPGGIAVLPVPIVALKTIEYQEPNPLESNHVRAPGLDYFDRYKPFFSKIVQYRSDEMPLKYQLYTYEDRRVWPTDTCPFRLPMEGERHIDIVPVCYY